MITRNRFTIFYLHARRAGGDLQQAVRYACARTAGALLRDFAGGKR